MNRITVIIIFLILFAGSIKSQTTVEGSPIKWYTIEEAQKLNDSIKKPIFIDVYTDWCGWCKRMMKTTFANQAIANYINVNFYPVRFNAETYDTIMYNGVEYINKGTGGKSTHELAKKILKGRLSYPTIVYIDREGNENPVPGYMKSKDIESLLVFFAEDLVKSVSFQDFNTLFMYTFPEVYNDEISKLITEKKPVPDTSGEVKWYTLKEATEKAKETQKPIYVYFYTAWCQSCKVYDTVLKDSVIAGLLNENFLPVKFDAASQDDAEFFGQLLGGTGPGNPHQFASAVLQGNFKFPAEAYISYDKKKLNEMHNFLTPEQLERVLSFFVEKAYTKQTFQEYIKTFKSKRKENN